MKASYNTKEVAAIRGISVQGVLDQAERESWGASKREGRGGGNEWRVSSMPEELQRQITLHETQAAHPDLVPEKCIEQARILALMDKWSGAPEWSHQRAEARLEILRAVDRLEATGMRRGKAEQLFCTMFAKGDIALEPWVLEQEKKVSQPTLLRWKAMFKKDGLAGLLSHHGSTRGERRSISPGLRIFLIGQLMERPHIRVARLHEMAREKFEDIPSGPSIYRFINEYKQNNPQLFALAENPKGWKNSFAPAFGDAATADHFGQIWEMDSTPADVMTADGKRCAIIGCVDVFSRRLVLLVAPTSKAVAVAATMRKALLRWGLPKAIRMDNGQDYRSKHITAILSSLHIERIFTRPYHGEDKPFIERALGTYTHGLHELLDFYTGHDVKERAALRERKTWGKRVMTRGEEPVRIPLTLEELQERTDGWLDYYETKAHRGLNGKTPLEMARASKRQPHMIHAKDERMLDVLLAPVSERVVGKKGLQLPGRVFTAPELVGCVGEKVTLYEDLEDAGKVYVFRKMNGRSSFWCVATDAALTGVRLEEYLQAKKTNERKLKEELRAFEAISKNNDDPYTLLMQGAAKRKQQAEVDAGNVVNFQAAAETPMLDEARKAFEEPEKVLGEAQELGLEPTNVIRPEFPQKEEPEIQVERPLFEGVTAPIDAYDWLCEQEKFRVLSKEDREWRAFLVENYQGVRDILELRAENAATAAMKKF